MNCRDPTYLCVHVSLSSIKVLSYFSPLNYSGSSITTPTPLLSINFVSFQMEGWIYFQQDDSLEFKNFDKFNLWEYWTKIYISRLLCLGLQGVPHLLSPLLKTVHSVMALLGPRNATLL